ncbi:MAG: zinc metallopeptidase [Clostridiales bacterium]|nr:zinc metallopeptidase [Clostridiales bacterium]
MYLSATWGLMLLALVISLFAQLTVSSTYNKYAKVRSQKNMSACSAARYILDFNGLTNVKVEQVRGNLTDHYDPRSKVLRLSESTYSSASVAALGVAAHEVGHALQDQNGYLPLRLRGALVPLANFSSSVSWVLILFGFLLSSTGLIDVGIFLFMGVLLFQVITLPVEFNASSRALAALEGGGLLETAELKQTKKVLSAAALTYVAAVLVSLLQLARLLLMRNRR